MAHPFPFVLPPRGSPDAPSLDPDDPRSVLDFFDDLEYLFEQAGVHGRREKKDHAVRYAPNSEKTIWRSLQEYAEPTKSFIDFKHAVIAEYISDDGQVWSTLRDLEILVTTTAQNGVHSLKEFGEYSRKFRNIAMQLVSGRYLREDERDYCFLQGLQASLRVQVVDHLQVTHPEVLAPRQQYSIAQVSVASS